MRGFRACRALTVAVLVLAGAALPTASASAGAGVPVEGASHTGAAAAGTTLEISVSSISPAIAGPGQDVTVTGTLSNRGATAVARPRVQVVLSDQPLATRRAVGAWAEGRGPAQGRVVGQKQLTAALPPSGSVPFRIEIAGAAGLRSPAYGALPLSIESGGAALHTFAGYQRQKEYVPLRVAWAVPLTIDGESDLFGAPGEARDEAWSRALGSGSRLARVVEATEASPVTWAIDPTLVPSLLPQEVEGSAEPGAPAAEPGSAASARAAMEQRIRASATEHTPWVLPDVDADVAAVADAGGGLALTSSLVARSASVASALGGRADIAWPADGRHSAARESALRRLFADPPLAGQLAAQSTLPLTGGTQDAHRRSADGLPILGYDDGLSALLAQTTTPASAALSTQRFIADSAALLDERPGTPSRSVLVAAPRSFNPDPSGAAGLLRTAASIPWLEPVSTDALLLDARRAVPMPKQVGTRPGATTPPSAGQPGQAGPPAAPRDPYAASPPLLTRARLQNLQENLRTVRGVATIREDGEDFSRIWGRASEQLASTRWRVPRARAEWSTLSRGVSGAIDETTQSITVSRRNINFIADTGRLQITVANELDVAVENVKLTLEPANPRLRIDSQPPLMRIGPNSRATAVVGVTTLAAGLVPIRTTLTTQDGTVIGQGADVVVRVTPTGDWVYWTLGAVAGIILLLGIWRSIRRRPAPVNAAEPTTTAQGAR